MTLLFVKRLLVVTAVLTMVAVSGFAATVDEGTCGGTTAWNLGLLVTTTTSSPYCEIGDKIFSNFAIYFTSGSGTTGHQPSYPTADQVNVQALNPYPSTTSDIGLEFNFIASNTVGYDQTMNLDIQYIVTVATGNPYLITSVYSQANGGTYVTGSGVSAEAIKNLCLGTGFNVSGVNATNVCPTSGTLVSAADYVLGGYTGSIPSVMSGTKTFTGVSVLGVSDVFAISGGVTAGAKNAEADILINTFGQTKQGGVPEPATFLLLGSALLGIGVLRRKLV
jgi:hypothetical protein